MNNNPQSANTISRQSQSSADLKYIGNAFTEIWKLVLYPKNNPSEEAISDSSKIK